MQSTGQLVFKANSVLWTLFSLAVCAKFTADEGRRATRCPVPHKKPLEQNCVSKTHFQRRRQTTSARMGCSQSRWHSEPIGHGAKDLSSGGYAQVNSHSETPPGRLTIDKNHQAGGWFKNATQAEAKFHHPFWNGSFNERRKAEISLISNDECKFSLLRGNCMPKIGTFDVDPAKRRLLTPQNLVELGITPASVQLILTANLPSLERTIVVNGAVVKLWPQGLSINETNFGNYTGPTAAALGWMSYLEIGAPLVEERADIIQPQADVLSTRAYENRSTTGADRGFSDTIGFSIENTISWSLEGTSQFTFEGHISAELQAQLALSLAQSLAHSVADSTSHTDILHNHRDNVGTETQDQTTTTTTDTTTNTTTYTGTGTGTGAAGLSAQLMLGITGSVSGTLTTSWNSSSTVSGNVPAGSRVETMATQRRQVRQYIYELPITFAGFVALQYAQPVPVFAEADNPQPGSTPATQVVARGITALGLVKDGQYYLPKGVAETVSTLEVEHIVFDSKSIPPAPNQTFGTVRPHNLQAS